MINPAGASSPNVVYVTGGGKCGTHLVAAYMEANCPDTIVYQGEFLSWKEDLPSVLPRGKHFVFHCPGTDLAEFQNLVPHGESVVLLRNPLQQYLAWIHSVHNWAMAERSFQHAPDSADSIFHFALERVASTFLRAHAATRVWRLEDFTLSSASREGMVAEILPIRLPTSDEVGTVNKSNYISSSTIIPVTEKDYEDSLSRFELESLLVHDHVFARYYPGWSGACNVVEGAEVIKERFFRVLTTNRHIHDVLKTRRDNAIAGILRGDPRRLRYYLFEHLAKVKFRYPAAYWSRTMDAELEAIMSDLPVFSRRLAGCG
jgi:hypothetical protein